MKHFFHLKYFIDINKKLELLSVSFIQTEWTFIDKALSWLHFLSSLPSTTDHSVLDESIGRHMLVDVSSWTDGWRRDDGYTSHLCGIKKFLAFSSDRWSALIRGAGLSSTNADEGTLLLLLPTHPSFPFPPIPKLLPWFQPVSRWRWSGVG